MTSGCLPEETGNLEIKTHKACTYPLTLPLSSCVASAELLNLSVPMFPYLLVGTPPLSEGGLKIMCVYMCKIHKFRPGPAKSIVTSWRWKIPTLTLVSSPCAAAMGKSDLLAWDSLAGYKFPERSLSMVLLCPGGGRCYRRLFWMPTLCGDIKESAGAELMPSTTLYRVCKYSETSPRTG